ncbi:uracil-DNA glycosylase [Glaciimonas immobilis]|uniref:Type-4 uracil-DNA glycosylase n=1 Tax=Glaciimonas immobilis TaxID=728004 RepID=A0A840RN15_9BURK|nr:uracil-DNA glycosylase [Glaciimonas immobilis]KAF3998972.1 uracil-DNA glycosylase [Glaciimonas immobilis]MBB5198386.1 DNA polymerase [Glaciimonas immobilis]
MNAVSRRAIFLEECDIGPLWVRRYDLVTPQITAPEITATVLFSDHQTAAMVAVVPTAELPNAGISTPAPAPAPLEAIPRVQGTHLKDQESAWEDGSLLPPEEEVSPWALVPTLIQPGTLKLSADAQTVLADIANMDIRQLKEAVTNCTRCGLCQGRQHTVFGVGDERAKWLFIGEGPGAAEDQEGEPFVGPAGKLLDNMLMAIGIRRGDNVYIANVVKCRPTDSEGKDRSPSAEEVAACLPYLQRQIAQIKPTVLVALGKTAALSLLALEPTTLVSSLRGRIHRYDGLPLIVTYHPAYLLRKPADKAKVWSDLCLAKTCYASTIA